MIQSPVLAAAVPCVNPHQALSKSNFAPFAKPLKVCASRIKLSAVSLSNIALTVTVPPAPAAFTTVSLNVVVTNDFN